MGNLLIMIIMLILYNHDNQIILAIQSGSLGRQSKPLAEG